MFCYSTISSTESSPHPQMGSPFVHLSTHSTYRRPNKPSNIYIDMLTDRSLIPYMMHICIIIPRRSRLWTTGSAGRFGFLPFCRNSMSNFQFDRKTRLHPRIQRHYMHSQESLILLTPTYASKFVPPMFLVALD